MKSSICTLIEKDYHLGLAALINSLIKNQFNGIIWVGYKGKIPPWIKNPIKKELYTESEIPGNITIRFIELKTTRHLTNYKAKFIFDILNDYSPETNKIFYFDPDIVIKKNWKFFDEWVDLGIAICEDCGSPLPADNWLHLSWQKFLKENNIDLSIRYNNYFNAGFLGIKRENIEFINTWIQLLDIVENKFPAITNKICVADEENMIRHVFGWPDQDCFNITMQLSNHQLCLLGKSGMGFGYELSTLGTPMFHYVSTKPWQIKSYFFDKLRARNSAMFPYAHLQYWQNAKTPIRPFSNFYLFFRKIDLKLYLLIGKYIKN